MRPLFILMSISFVPSALAQDGHSPPQLHWERPIQCMRDDDGRPIRVQCDETGGEKVCLWALDCQLGGRAGACKRLARTANCSHPGPDAPTRQDLESHGFRFVKAIAESPPGWARDWDGRVFQIVFDLNRRVWLGTRWPYSVGTGGRHELERVGFETGLRADVLSRNGRTRYRYSALVTEVILNPLSVQSLGLRIDTSHESRKPLLRFSTFWPDARRHDLYLNVGWWMELANVEHSPRGSSEETIVRMGGLGATLDLWHDGDLYSYVRLRLGATGDALISRRGAGRQRYTLTPMAAIEADVTFDDDGFHHLTFQSGYEAPWVFSDSEGFAQRFLSELAYEVIVLAINDQPVTLRASVAGGFRDDLLDEFSGWELVAGVGLRINLWVPAR